MMSRFVFIGLFLSFALLCIGCYTQLGTYESPLPTRQDANQHQGAQEPDEPDPDVNAEADVEDEGYYGRRKPGADAYAPYDGQYYIWDAYSPQPYLPYPYYDFYDPYGYYYPDYRYYGHYYYPNYYPRRYDRGDTDTGRRRRQSYRGRNSNRSSSERPKRSTQTEESNQSPASSSSESSDSRLRKMRSTKRRH